MNKVIWIKTRVNMARLQCSEVVIYGTLFCQTVIFTIKKTNKNNRFGNKYWTHTKASAPLIC
jgi:hypothetical protein